MGITGSAESVPKTTHYLLIMQAFFILALLPLAAFANHARALGHHAPAYAPAPAYTCRDTNTSVYAEVCVPAFTNVEKEVVLDVKVVEDNDYCYEQITTVCSLTNAEPVATCVVKVIEIDEVVCEDVKSQRCFNVPRLVDSTNTIIQSEVVLGEPKCDAVTLTLPTTACKKTHY